MEDLIILEDINTSKNLTSLGIHPSNPSSANHGRTGVRHPRVSPTQVTQKRE